jgi:hypothetical protein
MSYDREEQFLLCRLLYSYVILCLSYRKTPLDYATTAGKTEIAEVLIGAGADHNRYY